MDHCYKCGQGLSFTKYSGKDIIPSLCDDCKKEEEEEE